jgi:hypothetical protein
MSVLSDEELKDIELARKVITSEDVSIVVVKYNKIWKKKKEHGLKPLLDVIDEIGEELQGAIIGDKILGRASSLLCRYAQVAGVYSPQGTKTGIALLIMGGIPCQIDRMIPKIQNKDGSDLCPFEKMLDGITEPDKAYNILKNKILGGI